MIDGASAVGARCSQLSLSHITQNHCVCLQILLERFGCLGISLSEPFEHCRALLRVAEPRGLEGVVSKRGDAIIPLRTPVRGWPRYSAPKSNRRTALPRAARSGDRQQRPT